MIGPSAALLSALALVIVLLIAAGGYREYLDMRYPQPVSQGETLRPTHLTVAIPSQSTIISPLPTSGCSFPGTAEFPPSYSNLGWKERRSERFFLEDDFSSGEVTGTIVVSQQLKMNDTFVERLLTYYTDYFARNNIWEQYLAATGPFPTSRAYYVLGWKIKCGVLKVFKLSVDVDRASSTGTVTIYHN